MNPSNLQPNAATEHALESAPMLLSALEEWVELGWLRPLDSAFARMLHKQVEDAPPLLLLAAALASYQLGRGHVCLELTILGENPERCLSLPPSRDPARLRELTDLLRSVPPQEWLAALAHTPLVGAGEGNTPLVRVGTRLYLRRYWRYEEQIRQAIRARLSAADALTASLPPPQILKAQLDALFPPARTQQTDWQKIACALAARNIFTVITGGPGTGKTTTVVRLLALLQTIALGASGAGRALRIRLAAPTGKAAARLSGSIAGALEKLMLSLPAGAQGERILKEIPKDASTLHRLLGSRPDTRHFRHNRQNPLQLDVLVVDEASMVDVEMMAMLLDALPARARLILLGDKDQLASVEAGAVLGELCHRAALGHYTPSTRGWLQQVTGESIEDRFEDPQGTPLDQAIVMLRHSHRFDAASGIGRLAEAVNEANQAGVSAVWKASPPYADLCRVYALRDNDAALVKLVVGGGAERFANGGRDRVEQGKPVPPPVGYAHYLKLLSDGRPPKDAQASEFDAWAARLLGAYGQFQVLCALRKGPWGVEGLNRRIAQALNLELAQSWFEGRPVLVTRNDHQLGLMNGDIGIALSVPQRNGSGRPVLRVAFQASDGGKSIRWILPSRLQSVETAFAMTVHKSQGSEFAHVALVLPEGANPVVTRELIYTGITRASRWFSLILPSDKVLEEGVARSVERVSGLVTHREGRAL